MTIACLEWLGEAVKWGSVGVAALFLLAVCGRAVNPGA